MAPLFLFERILIMAKKTVEKEAVAEEAVNEVLSNDSFSNRKAELKQKIEDSLNGKVILDQNDWREVLQYL